MRVASIKSMAAVFTAFDHTTYQKLISQHIEDIATMPASIITMFRQGAFVVNISGRPWHSVGIDDNDMVRENHDYTSIVRLFVMHNSRSGSLTNKIGCRNSLTPGTSKITVLAYRL